MQRTRWSAILPVLLLLPLAAYANDELLKLQKDPGQWVMQRKNYAATGYSDLNQITVDNVKKLKVAWTFSTGALRGHEGAPLVVGTTMYVHSAFPNHVYALDLTKQPYAIKWYYSPKQDAKAVPVAAWHEYLRESFAANKPWDQLVREILSADGSDPKQLGPARFYLDRNRELNEVTRDISRAFLGMNLQCAQCHDHPLVADYKQEFYYGLIAFLNRSYVANDPKLRTAVRLSPLERSSPSDMVQEGYCNSRTRQLPASRHPARRRRNRRRRSRVNTRRPRRGALPAGSDARGSSSRFADGLRRHARCLERRGAPGRQDRAGALWREASRPRVGSGRRSTEGSATAAPWVG